MSTISTTLVDNVLVVKPLESRIVETTRIREIAEELSNLLQDPPAKLFLLSFHEVQFMSSEMIGRIIEFKKKCETEGVDLRFSDFSSDLMTAIKLLQLHRRWEIYDNEFKALQKMNGKRKGLFG